MRSQRSELSQPLLHEAAPPPSAATTATMGLYELLVAAGGGCLGRKSKEVSSFKERFSRVRRVGAHARLGDFYFHMLRMSAKATIAFWAVWWFVSGIVIGAMWWGAITTLEGNVVFRLGVEGVGNVAHDYAACLYYGLSVMADAEDPLVEGGAAEAILIIAGLWRTISMALFIACLLEKIADPRARIRFAKQALLTSVDGKPALTLRLASEKSGFLVDAEVRIFVLQHYRTPEGWHGQRPVELKLRTSHMPMLSLSWNLTHIITPDSPLAPYASLIATCGPPPQQDDAASPSDKAPLGSPDSGSSSGTFGGAGSTRSRLSMTPSMMLPDLSQLEVLVFFKAEDTVQHETIRANHSYVGSGDFVVDGRYADVIHLAPARMVRGGGTVADPLATHVDGDDGAQRFGRLGALLGRLWGGPGRTPVQLRAQYGPRATLLDLYALDTIVEATCELPVRQRSTAASAGATAAAAPAPAAAAPAGGEEEGGADADVDGGDAAAKAV